MHTAFIIVAAVMAILILAGAPLASTPFNQRRKRRGIDPSNRPTPKDFPPVFSINSAKLRVTVPANMSLNGTPQVAATGGAHIGTEVPLLVAVISPTILELTYAHAIATGDSIVYPAHDPAVRFAAGAYVAAKTQTL